jgi:4-hydroxy-3-methylbut-2-enyl diphosphate reductase
MTRGPDPGAVVCTPLVVEHAAVRRGLRRVGAAAEVPLLRTGMGPRRSRAGAARISGASAVLVAGVAGALDPALSPGDLVVATEISTVDGAEPVRCDSAPLLEEALLGAGLTPHLGRVVCVPRLRGERPQHALAATGALAVDMESAYLAASSPGRAIAVLRVIVDTPRAPLLRPGTVARGIRALRILETSAGAIVEWARSVQVTGRSATYGVNGTVGADLSPPREVI